MIPQLQGQHQSVAVAGGGGAKTCMQSVCSQAEQTQHHVTVPEGRAAERAKPAMQALRGVVQDIACYVWYYCHTATFTTYRYCRTLLLLHTGICE